MKKTGIQRSCWLLDTFNGFNYGTANDFIDPRWVNTHLSYNGLSGNEAIERIRKMTAGLQNEIHVQEFNAISDDLPAEIQNVANANIDVDMYEPTLRALNMLAPRLISGGIITMEDPAATFALYGAYLAVHNFLESENGKDFFMLRSDSTFFLIKY